MPWTSGVFALDASATDAFPGKVLASADWNTIFTQVIAGFNQITTDGPVNPYFYGAVGNGIADDTAPLQAAITAAVAAGRDLYLGAGDFKITTELSVTGGLKMYGAGWSSTSIKLGSATMNGIVVNTNDGCSFSDFQITGANNGTISQATAGSLISITGPSVNQQSSLQGMRLLWGFISLSFTSAQIWTINDCHFLGNPTTGTGLVIQNTGFPGNGEFEISNSLIQGGDAVTTWGGSGIFHASGVNLKIVNSSIFGWVNGYNLTLGSATAMAGTFISNCVFSQVEQGITLNKGTGTQYNVVQIDNCEIFARNPIASDANTGWLFDVSVTNCHIGPGQGSPVSAATGTGVSFPAVNTFTIANNLFSGAAASASIVIGVNSSNGSIVGNQLRGTLTAASNSSVTTVLEEFNAGGSAALKFSGATNGFQFGNVVSPIGNDGAPLGAAGGAWSDLFLAEGGVINWDSGDVTITQTNNVLSFAGATTRYEFDANLTPVSSDGAALGTTGLQFSDLFLAEGGVINWDNGDVTLTQTGDILALAGGTLVYPGIYVFTATAVNMNSVADTTFTITLPSGFTRYRLQTLIISHASTDLTAATTVHYALFTAAGGGGTAVVADTASTVSATTEVTNNNAQFITPGNFSINSAQLFFRVTTAHGSAATADVTLQIQPLL